MTLVDITAPTKDGEQLTFKAFQLAEVVRELDSVEIEKKEANENWNIQIKALKKHIVKLAYECEKAD